MKKLNPLQPLDNILKNINEGKSTSDIKLFESVDSDLKKINDHIGAHYQLEVAPHDGGDSFYWCSDDKGISLYLAGLPSTTVEGVSDLKQMDAQGWLAEADKIMKGYKTKVNESFDPKSYTKESAERIGDLVEYMDIHVSTTNKPKFQAIIEPACDAVDPDSSLSIAECFKKMGDAKAQEILGELVASNLGVNYQEFGVAVAESINEAVGPEVTFFDVQFGLGHAAQGGLIDKEEIDPILAEIKTNRIKVDELKKLLSKTGKTEKIMDLINKGAEGADMSESVDGTALPGSNLYLYGKGKDINGNSVVRVGFPNQRGFSIQTNGDLPKTDSILKGGAKIASLSDSDLKTIGGEVAGYVKENGSDEQKKSLRGDASPANEAETEPEVKKLMEVFGVSEILAKNIQNTIKGRKENGGDKAEFLGAISAIISKPVAQVMKLIKQFDASLLEDTKPINEGIGSDNKGGFSDAVWNQPPIKEEGSAFGWVGHNSRTEALDKELETKLKKAGWDDLKIACFVISADGRKYGDSVGDNNNTGDQIISKFDKDYKPEEWVGEALKVNESVDRKPVK